MFLAKFFLFFPVFRNLTSVSLLQSGWNPSVGFRVTLMILKRCWRYRKFKWRCKIGASQTLSQGSLLENLWRIFYQRKICKEASRHGSKRYIVLFQNQIDVYLELYYRYTYMYVPYSTWSDNRVALYIYYHIKHTHSISYQVLRRIIYKCICRCNFLKVI